MADVLKDSHDWTREGGYAPKAPEAAPTPLPKKEEAKKPELVKDEPKPAK